MPVLQVLVLLVAMLQGGQAWAQATEKRVALVIGNNAYAEARPLQKAVGDARAIASALVEIGFASEDVQLVTDADRPTMNRAIAEFISRVRDADVALLFFAGHAVELAGANYLIPVDVPDVTSSPAGEPLLRSEAISFDWLMGELEAANPRSTLVILDACRDNPFVDAAGRSLGGRRGIADVQPPEGVFIAYSAGARQQALDRLSDTDPDPNSVFTRVFLKYLRTPGLSIREMVLKTRPKVRELARPHNQFPAYYDQLTQDVVLLPPVSEPSPLPSTAFDQRQPDFSFWEAIKASRNPTDFEAYLEQFPNGIYARLARNRLAELQAQQQVAVEVARPKLETMMPVQPAVGVYGDAARKPGDVFRDCAVGCPEMVVVPAGSFVMGSPASDPERYKDEESPQHRVSFARPFAVGRYEVTFEEWDACVAEGGCGGYRPADQGWGRGRRPVIRVSWHNAKAYVEWLSRKTKQSYRLLSEAEWEYVARAGTTTRYWWGDTIRPEHANYRGSGPGKTTEVGSYPVNPWGLYDMHGNVFEWVEDVWHDNYQGAPVNGSAWLKGSRTDYRVFRDGSWASDTYVLRAARRGSYPPDTSLFVLGFRCARVLEE